MPVPDSPIAITLGSWDIRWYSLLATLSIAIAVILTSRELRKRGLSDDALVDMLLAAIPAGIIGARAYYVLFHWDFYGQDLSRVLAFREGGLAIHGALFLGIPAAWLYARKKGIDFLAYLDITAPSIALAQAIARWGNYFNVEAYGAPTDLPWGMVIEGVAYHPAFLYESLWNIGLFIVLWHILQKKAYAKGYIGVCYMVGYSLGRLWIEQLRLDSEWIGPLKAASVWSVLGLIIGAYLIYKMRKGDNHKEDHHIEA